MHARFQTQGVACAQTCWLDALREQCIPERDGGLLRQHDFETVFAGVAGARKKQFDAIARTRLQCSETAELARRCGVGRVQQVDDIGACVGALHGDHREVAALFHAHIEAYGLLADPLQIFSRVAALTTNRKKSSLM